MRTWIWISPHSYKNPSGRDLSVIPASVCEWWGERLDRDKQAIEAWSPGSCRLSERPFAQKVRWSSSRRPLMCTSGLCKCTWVMVRLATGFRMPLAIFLLQMWAGKATLYAWAELILDPEREIRGFVRHLSLPWSLENGDGWQCLDLGIQPTQDCCPHTTFHKKWQL